MVFFVSACFNQRIAKVEERGSHCTAHTQMLPAREPSAFSSPAVSEEPGYRVSSPVEDPRTRR
jgi:hypothetical protein